MYTKKTFTIYQCVCPPLMAPEYLFLYTCFDHGDRRPRRAMIMLRGGPPLPKEFVTGDDNATYHGRVVVDLKSGKVVGMTFL